MNASSTSVSDLQSDSHTRARLEGKLEPSVAGIAVDVQFGELLTQRLRELARPQPVPTERSGQLGTQDGASSATRSSSQSASFSRATGS